MSHRLTGVARASAEQRRISLLTDPHDTLFKVIISHQIENSYRFGSISNCRGRPIAADRRLKLYHAFGRFLDSATKLSISRVEEQYKRPSDSSDETYDPETGLRVKIEHFCLFAHTDDPRPDTDSARIHGYFRADYFIVTRMDWFHHVHP